MYLLIVFFYFFSKHTFSLIAEFLSNDMECYLFISVIVHDRN